VGGGGGGWGETQLSCFLTTTLVTEEWLTSQTDAFTTGKETR